MIFDFEDGYEDLTELIDSRIAQSLERITEDYAPTGDYRSLDQRIQEEIKWLRT